MPRVDAVFGTSDPTAVAEVLTEGVATTLGVPVGAARFYEPGVGVVVGLELADGRAVVAKVRRGANGYADVTLPPNAKIDGRP